MAQIIVTATPVNLNVSTTQSNITVTDVETNVTVNVASLSSNIAVTSTPVNVTISPSVGVSNAEIRAALSATTPIVYNNNTGEFTFDPSANNMQLNSVTANSFITTPDLTVTNNATISGLLNVANISIAGDLNANLKDISLSYYDAGNVSGNVTLDVANGPVQKIRLTNNLTGLTFTGATAAQPITLIIEQDNVGFWTLDTTTYTSNWTNWLFTSNFKTLSTTANANDLLSITYDGTSYFASLVNFVQTLITNAELANSNVVVNGTTISLGSSGNISHFGALTTTALPEGTNLYFSAARVRGNVSAATPLTYNSGTGQFGFADFAQIGGLNVNSTQAYAGVSLRVNKYTGGGNPNAMDVIGNATVSERLTVSGNVSGNYFLGNGAFLTGVTSLTNAQVIAHIATVPLTVGGNLTVNGNINATGNINVQNVEDLYVRDQTIVLNANAASPANVQIVSNRPGSANTMLKWNEQTDRWTFTNDGTTYFNIPTSTTDLAEGTNLYYTTDRANTAIGAYQGDINTPGTVTATTANATTVNVTDLNATNNVTVLGKLNAADGSNIQYVRAYSAEFLSTNTATGLSILLEGESNNRISVADAGQFRYVPGSRTLLVNDGTIGASAANTSFAGVNLFLTGNITATPGNMSVGNITVNTVAAGFLSGNGTQITAINGANVFGLSTTQVAEGTNLYFTTDRANTAIGAYTGNINVNVVSANQFVGNGAQISEITGANVFGMNSDQIFEGSTNLFYTTDRANTAIGAYQGSINTVGNISTTANVEGQYILGNGAFLTGITSGSGTVTQVNTGENLTGGPITTTGTIGLANALGNVNSVTSQANVNFAINTDEKLVVTQNFKGRAVAPSGNVEHDGYAFFGGDVDFNPVTSYTGNANVENFTITSGNTTSGSNAITGISVAKYVDGVTPANVSDISVNSIVTLNEDSPYPFPYGTVVTSVDAANSTIYMSQPAVATQNLLDPTFLIAWFFQPVLLDTDTGLALRLVSEFDDTGSGSKTTVVDSAIAFQSRYGYPRSGWAISDFDVFTAGVAGDYTLADSSAYMTGRNKLTAPNTVLQAPRGLVVGERADLTNRAENDDIPSFGVSVLWDGTSNTAIDYSNTEIITQVLVKSYTDGTGQQGDFRSNYGPRLLFTASEGNATEPYSETYPRENLELGRVAWWGAAKGSPNLGTVAPSGWISGVTGQDQITRNSGMGMYFGIKPNVNNGTAGIWLASTKGRTLLAGGYEGSTTANITLAPLNTTISNGNSVQMYENAITSKVFANVGYANMSSQTGSRLTITNGPEQSTPGNFVIEIDRNVTPPGLANVTLDSAPYGIVDAGGYGGTADHAMVGIYYSGSSGIAPTTTAITLNSVTGPGAANVNGQTFYIINSQSLFSQTNFYLYSDAGLTTPVSYSSLGVDPYATDGGYLEYTVTPVSVSKNWSIELEQAVEDLKLKADGNTVVTFTDAGNISATTFIGNVSGTTGVFTGNVTANTTVVDKIAISTTGVATANATGEIVWNTGFGGLDLKMNSIDLNIGQQQIFYGKLTEPVSKGNVIMFAGAQGSHFLISKADVDAPGFIDEYVIGLAAEDGTTNDFIYVTTFGRINQVDTFGFTEGDLLYLDVNTPGALANVAPTAPSRSILVAALGKEESSGPANNGTIFVRPTFGKSVLSALHDVKITSAADNQILRYDSGNTVWVNQNLGSAITTANVKLKQFSETVVSLGSVSGDISSSIDVANGTIYQLTATGGITINSLANAAAGTSATIIVTQDGTGGHTLTSSMLFAGASKTLSTAAGAIDIISVFYDGTTYYATLSKGYA